MIDQLMAVVNCDKEFIGVLNNCTKHRCLYTEAIIPEIPVEYIVYPVFDDYNGSTICNVSEVTNKYVISCDYSEEDRVFFSNYISAMLRREILDEDTIRALDKIRLKKCDFKMHKHTPEGGNEIVEEVEDFVNTIVDIKSDEVKVLNKSAANDKVDGYFRWNRSVFFSSENLNSINEALALHNNGGIEDEYRDVKQEIVEDFTSRELSGGGTDGGNDLQKSVISDVIEFDNALPDYISLDAVVYIDSDRWSIWVNKNRYSKGNEIGIRVLSVDRDYVHFSLKVQNIRHFITNNIRKSVDFVKRENLYINGDNNIRFDIYTGELVFSLSVHQSLKLDNLSIVFK